MSNIHELGRQSNGDGSLTHSILINLFLKLELSNFHLPPLLSIVFVPWDAFVWDQSGIRIIGIKRVSVCLGAILIPE